MELGSRRRAGVMRRRSSSALSSRAPLLAKKTSLSVNDLSQPEASIVERSASVQFTVATSSQLLQRDVQTHFHLVNSNISDSQSDCNRPSKDLPCSAASTETSLAVLVLIISR